MSVTAGDKGFAGSIPEIYDRLLVPLLFEGYASDLAQRLAERPPASVLEVAAGTGVVTRALALRLPLSVRIVATDLNAPMIDRARAAGTAREVEWRTADAMSLPFPDESFDAVVCQFGVMFFPDKAKALGEARRVLRDGGRLLFNAWDSIEENEFADVVTTALRDVFPEDPPLFLRRMPHGYFDIGTIRRDLRAAGFDADPRIATVAGRSRAESAREVAFAYCCGTPLYNEIVARDASSLDEATEVAAAAVRARFGHGAVDSRIQAHVVDIGR